MKLFVKNYSNVFVLVSSILFLILGAIMYTKPDAVVIITTYIFGGILILIGLFKCVKNYLDVKKDNDTRSTEMVVGIVMIILGIVCIFLADVVEAIVRFIIGGWILFSGINRLINSFNLTRKDRRFVISLILSFILIGGGLYTILEVNLAFKAIGLVLMIYSILEMLNYIFNKGHVEYVRKTKVIDAELIGTKEK